MNTKTLTVQLRVWIFVCVIMLLTPFMPKSSADLVLNNSESIQINAAPDGNGGVNITWSYYATWNTDNPAQGNNVHLQAYIDGFGVVIPPGTPLQSTTYVYTPVGTIPGTIIAQDWQVSSSTIKLAPGHHTAGLLVARNRINGVQSPLFYVVNFSF